MRMSILFIMQIIRRISDSPFFQIDGFIISCLAAVVNGRSDNLSRKTEKYLLFCTKSAGRSPVVHRIVRFWKNRK